MAATRHVCRPRMQVVIPPRHIAGVRVSSKKTAAICHSVYPPVPSRHAAVLVCLLVTQALARDRERRSLEEGGGDD